MGRSDGACRHVAACLYEIEAFERKSCTEGPVRWKRRSRQHDVATTLSKLVVKKARYAFPCISFNLEKAGGLQKETDGYPKHIFKNI